MLKTIRNRFFTTFRDDGDGKVIALASCQIHLNSPTLFTDIRRSIKNEINFWYKYIFEFKSATVPLKEIKSKWDHLPCKQIKDWGGYKWGRLKESLETTGTYGTLYIIKLGTQNMKNYPTYQYRVVNGNHRIAVLKCLYGPEHKIKIKYQTDLELERLKDTKPMKVRLFHDGKTDLEVVSVKAKISNIQHDYIGATLEDLYDPEYRKANNIAAYDWKEFIEDIKLNGITEPPLLELHETRTIHYKPSYIGKLYLVCDGNHRIKALELIHGPNYTIDADLIVSKKINKLYLEQLKQNRLETATLVHTRRQKELKSKYI